MPKSLPKRVHGLAASTVIAFLALATPSLAGTCANEATSNPFKAFGDSAAYALVQNGAFEAGTSGWSLTSSSVVAGNESYKVHGSGDAKSLAVQATGKAITPSFCVDDARPSFRFFAKRTSGTWGVLNVVLRWTDNAGVSHDTTLGSLSGNTYLSKWQATPVLPLSTVLPLNGGTMQAKIVFDPENYGGHWAIDDVYVDPYSR